MNKLLDETAAAHVLSLRPKTLTRWRWGGKGPSYCKIGGSVRYCVADLEKFIAENKVAAND